MIMQYTFSFVLVLLLSCIESSVISKRGEPDRSSGGGGDAFTIQMPGATPKGSDSYLCTGFNIDRLAPGKNPVYLTKYEPLATASKAHHLLLFACDEAIEPEGQIWDCRHHRVCGGQKDILYAWAKNAPPTEMPKDVSFTLDTDKRKFLILQVHYVHELEEPDDTGLTISYQTSETRYSAGIYLMVRSYLNIPAHSYPVHGDVNCLLKSDYPIHPFAFRTHAHQWGSVITGYVYDPNTEKYTEIARGNPQWPQAFYPVVDKVAVEPGQFLTARCTFNTTANDKDTRIGATAGDEMCNLYLMYYAEAGKGKFQTCVNEESYKVIQNLPADSDTPLPPNPDLESTAKNGRKKGNLESLPSLSDSNKGRKKGDLDRPVLSDPELSEWKSLQVTMPGALPNHTDEYLCSSFKISELTKGKTVYLTEFVAAANALKAHHLLLSKCDKPTKQPGEIWNCIHHATCQGNNRIMYAWAKDAPPTQVPPDVGFKIGDNQDDYLVLQVHYKHSLPEKDHTGVTMFYTEDKPKYTAGIFLLGGWTPIPPHLHAAHVDTNCKVDFQKPIHLFAFRTHAHALGSVITGYRVREGQYKEIARGDPQKPQTFYPMKEFVDVKAGDVLAARCTYNSEKKDTTTNIGSTSGDEMCNLYIMYYTEEPTFEFATCWQNDEKISENLPGNSDKTIAELQMEQPQDFSNALDTSQLIPVKDKKTKGAYPVEGMYMPPQQPRSVPGYGMAYDPNFPYQNQYATYPPPQPYNPYGSAVMQPQFNNYGDGGGGFYSNNGDGSQDASYYSEGQPYRREEAPSVPKKGTSSSRKKSKPKDREPKKLKSAELYPVPNWPPKATADQLGQLSGVSIDIYGNPVVFHRGDRTWNLATFKLNNEYAGDKTKPIEQNTILTLNATGHVINAWGSGMFFLPHMITVDKQNNVWVTDVAMHQVFKFPPYGGADKKPKIVLGQPFMPGSDDTHYCKPTSVAVMSSGEHFFVSDGYCNSRIIKYGVSVDTAGHHKVTKVMQWGEAKGGAFSVSKSPYSLNVPHGMALAEDKSMLCVADRENGRIQCFRTDDGKFVKSIQPPEFTTVYSVAYSPAEGGRLFAACGPDRQPFSSKSPEGFVIDINTGDLISKFNGDGDGFQNPHDIAVTKDGVTVFEVELNPFKVWKLTNGLGSSNTLASFPAVPTNSPSVVASSGFGSKIGIDQLGSMIPQSGYGVYIAMVSVPLTCVFALCISVKRCRKRGRGTLTGSRGSKKKDGKLDLGDFLGRSKEGFQPVKTEDEDDAGNISSDSDIEEFSVPALHA